MPHKNISIVIPVYNGGDAFRTCLSHLLALDPQPTELIVVDDGSTDDSSGVAQSFGVQLLTNLTTQGPAHARNQGARIAHGDILFFVDADVALPRDTLSHILMAFQQEPEIAALIGSYDDAPAAPNFLSQYKNLFHHYVHQTSHDEASTFWGACGAIQREIFLSLGGFDRHRYAQPSIEDIELGYRLKEAGYSIRLVKSLQVKHLKRWNARSLIRTDFFQRALPWAKLILQRRAHGNDQAIINDLNLQTSSRISVGLVAGIVILFLVQLALIVFQQNFFPLTIHALNITTYLHILQKEHVGIIIALFVSNLFVLNINIYRFFLNKRGFWFTLCTIPWHWFYYLYSGLAFALMFFRCALFVRNTQKKI